MKHLTIIALVALSQLRSDAAATPSKPIVDYAYFQGTGERQTIMIIGSSFAGDVKNNSNCQTRTQSAGKTSDWHDAININRAVEDQYRFRAADNSSSAEIIEVRVKGADGSYTAPIVTGDGRHYRERFLTFGSPHDCIGTNVQVKWCQKPKPELGTNFCPDTRHALVCQKTQDYVVVGVHFDAGSVSNVTIRFNYGQFDLHGAGATSDSVLKRATSQTGECPPESAFKIVTNLNRTCHPSQRECFPATDQVVPGRKDVAVFYMFKRRFWPSVLNINEVQLDTVTRTSGP